MNSINLVLKSCFHLAISLLLFVSVNAFAISTTEYGAYGDGIHDDTSALQSALTYCSVNNKVCQIPEGKKHLVTGPLFVWGGA